MYDDQMRAELESEYNAGYDDEYERWADMRAEAEAAARWAEEDAQAEAERTAAWWAAFDPSGELWAAYAAYWDRRLYGKPWHAEPWEGSDEPPF